MVVGKITVKKQRIKHSKVIVFAGAGASARLGMPIGKVSLSPICTQVNG